MQPSRSTPQPRPSGPTYQITDDWLAWARARIDETGATYASIAEVSGVTPSAISDIFRGVSKQTRILPQINAALGGMPPTQIVILSQLDGAKARIDAAWRDLDDRERDLVSQLVDVLQRAHGKH